MDDLSVQQPDKIGIIHFYIKIRSLVEIFDPSLEIEFLEVEKRIIKSQEMFSMLHVTHCIAMF